MTKTKYHVVMVVLKSEAFSLPDFPNRKVQLGDGKSVVGFLPCYTDRALAEKDYPNQEILTCETVEV